MTHRRSLPLLVGLAFSATLFLAGCGNPIHQNRDFMVQKLGEELGLTDAQKSILLGMHGGVVSILKADPEAQKARLELLIALVKSDTIDPEKADALEESVRSSHLAMQALVRSNLVEFHKTLTPAQKGKLATLLTNMHEKLQEMLE